MPVRPCPHNTSAETSARLADHRFCRVRKRATTSATPLRRTNRYGAEQLADARPASRQGRASDDYTPRIRRSNASYQTAMMAVRTPGCPCCLVADTGLVAALPLRRCARPKQKRRSPAARSSTRPVIRGSGSRRDAAIALDLARSYVSRGPILATRPALLNLVHCAWCWCGGWWRSQMFESSRHQIGTRSHV